MTYANDLEDDIWTDHTCLGKVSRDNRDMH